MPSATPISLPTEIDPLENPKVRTVFKQAESLSRLIPEAAEIVMHQVDRLNDEVLPPASSKLFTLISATF